MVVDITKRTIKAHCADARRALSLLELVTVVAILGVVTVAGASYYGISSLGNTGAHGFARKLSLSLMHARRSTISTGDNHYLSLSSSGGSVTSYALYRRDSGGDVQVDQTRTVPSDVTVTSSASTLEFDFDGTAIAGYTVSIAGPNRSWDIVVVAATGAVSASETTP